MGWNMRPRRIRLLGDWLVANVSLKKLLKGEGEPVSFTRKIGPWSRNSRTDRTRWTLPFGIYHLGKKRR